MKIVITGGRGFIGQNLRVRLSERPAVEIVSIDRSTASETTAVAVSTADVVFHLAGVNRPADPAEFAAVNAGFTAEVLAFARRAARAPRVVLASSTQAAMDNPYGASKREAEGAVRAYADDTGASCAIYRLPNVFGKWSRPNYNSVVATFCHNVARGLPIRVDDPARAVDLVYIDDVLDAWLDWVTGPVTPGEHDGAVAPIHRVTVGDLRRLIEGFRASRQTLMPGDVGHGFERALYSTYVSFLPPEAFAYAVTTHEDPRGRFVEFVKNRHAGQCSFFTAGPGVTRGGHYHHTKTEKFLVVEGRARFRFRHLVTGEAHVLETDGARGQVVETVPGWAHDITNVGTGPLIVMLWANEVFDPARPDTIASPLS